MPPTESFRLNYFFRRISFKNTAHGFDEQYFYIIILIGKKLAASGKQQKHVYQTDAEGCILEETTALFEKIGFCQCER